MIIKHRFNGFFAAVVAAGLLAGAPSTATAATFGYGDFLGEFSGALNDTVTELAGYQVEQIAKWEATAQGDIDFVMTAFKEGEPIGGTWESLNGPSTPMILGVKYGNQFSLFRYPLVETGDTGLFASDPTLTGFPMSTNRNGKPFAISNVRAYSVIPLPPALLLIATAFATLFGYARLRKT